MVSCGRSSLPASEYINWLENVDNGLIKSKVIGDVTYRVVYKTRPYIILKKTDPIEVEKLNMKEEIEKYSDMEYFDFQIEHEQNWDPLKAELASSEDYYLRLKYYSFDLEKDIVMVEGGDTIPCAFSHFERTYGIVPYINVGLAFPKSELQSDKTIIYNDPVFNAGLVKFQIKQKNINNIPDLNI